MNQQVQETSGAREATQPAPRYLIPEDRFHHGNQQVVQWTRHFQDRAARQHVFTNIEATLSHLRPSAGVVAETMGSVWLDFSRFVPAFLARAAAKTSDPVRQHHLIQICWDELGGSDKERIHSKLFEQSLAAAAIALMPSTSGASIRRPLDHLDRTLEAIRTDAANLGLLLSFEIIAETNIETLFKGLCRDQECERVLSDHVFFKIHRADESEHIRHSVANFLRFCQTKRQRTEFARSFDDGIGFWRQFWDETARLMHLEVSTRANAFPIGPGNGGLQP